MLSGWLSYVATYGNKPHQNKSNTYTLKHLAKYLPIEICEESVIVQCVFAIAGTII